MGGMQSAGVSGWDVFNTASMFAMWLMLILMCWQLVRHDHNGGR